MSQPSLFDHNSIPYQPLESFIERHGDNLVIPEGLRTVPCTHGIHRFAGKFIPNLPRFIIREILANGSQRTILDPYCGSGTTLVEAALEGWPYVGIDIDPLSIAISTAKCTPLTQDELETLVAYWRDHDFEIEQGDLIPDVPNLNHWFTDQAVKELSSIKARCLELPNRLRLFCLVVFSSIIRRTSNADDQSQKTYVSHTLPKNPPLPSTLFPVFLARAIEGMREYCSRLPRQPEGAIVCTDAARDLTTHDFDHVLTSPPYIDSIDYVYNNMLEYFWLLDELGIKSYEGYRSFRKRPMGFRLHNRSELATFAQTNLSKQHVLFEKICLSIGKVSPKEELTVRSYFADYARHVRLAHSKQPTGSLYVCIVGNSVIRRTEVPTVDIIQDVHLTNGYELEDRMTYQIKRHYMKFPRRSNSGKITQDNILVFRAVE